MFINFWYVACRSEDLGSERPLKVRMLGHQFALWRDASGRAHCAANTCPHRGGALGDGRLHDGCLECPYHGWTFDPTGDCGAIPSLGKDARIPERTRIDVYPVTERYGLVHVFLGDLDEADRPPVMPVPEHDNPAWRGQLLVMDWSIDYKRSVENTLDCAHNEFVHPTHGFMGRNDDYKVAPLTLQDGPWGTGFMVPMYTPPLPDREMHDASGRHREGWAEGGSGNIGPNATWTHIHISPQAHFHNYTFHTPLDERTDRIFLLIYRNFMLDAKHDPDFEKSGWRVAGQDKVVLEAMTPFFTPPHQRHEFLTPSDLPVARYREFCADWERRGWRLDVPALISERERAGSVIPSPRRRQQPRGWVLPPAPLLAGD